jgi:NTE family protein
MAIAAAVTACATRPVNPRLDAISLSDGYRSGTQAQRKQLKDTEILITFSGGGTRAAAFAYGVLEELKRQTANVRGLNVRLLD